MLISNANHSPRPISPSGCASSSRAPHGACARRPARSSARRRPRRWRRSTATGRSRPSELAARERIQRPTATRVIARLEETGLVDRTQDPADRRSFVVALTPAGRALLARVRTRKDAYLARRLRDLDADERATLDRAAAILERVLEEAGAR